MRSASPVRCLKRLPAGSRKPERATFEALMVSSGVRALATDDDGVSKGERRSSVVVPSDRSDRFAADTAGDVCDSIGSNGAWLTIGRAEGASEVLRGRLASGKGRPAALPSPVELPVASDFTVLINSGILGARETVGRAKGASEVVRGRLASGRGRPAALPSPVEFPFAGDFTVLINSGTSGARETIGRAGFSGDDEGPVPLNGGAPFHSPVVSAAIISLDVFVEARATPPSAPRAC